MNDNNEQCVPIPEHLFQIIPKCGQYLKSIMKLTGFNDVHSVCRLNDPVELKNMFAFAADIADAIENKDEVYGIFSRNPERLRILPGIAQSFKRFLDEVDKLKPPDTSTNSRPKLKRKSPSKNVSIECVENQVLNLYKELCVKKSFRIVTKNDNFLFTCLNCHWESVLLIHDENVACLKFIKEHISLHCINLQKFDLEPTETPSSSKWNSRSFRNQSKLVKASTATGQTKITDFFDIDKLTSAIDQVTFIREKVNKAFEIENDYSVKPILKLLYANAIKNSNVASKSGQRHHKTIKMFGAYLYYLNERAGYELLLDNLGVGLPSLPTVFRMINDTPRIKEGEFLFDELSEHLNKWNSPKFVHVHMDDTRVLNKVEYDPVTDRFVGFVLPLKNGLPDEDAFVLTTFVELKNVYEKTSIANYAHCIVAKPLTVDAPSFVLFVLGTDSKYDHTVILSRWIHIECEFNKRGITAISFGADGAGAFMKAMLQRTGLFNPTEDLLRKSYLMREICSSGLSAQDHIHLLAKLRTRLLIPSNILVLGKETACLAHMRYILDCDQFSKEDHQLTERIISNKDKQNYSGIEVLLSDGVRNCLDSCKNVMQNFGTITYLSLMCDIRDSFLNKSLKPSDRLVRIWRVVFFLRLWKKWLKENGFPEKDHFITTNAYVCVEINAHLLLEIVSGVILGKLPKESLRVWLTGSQGCESLFRLARSMTSTFSTIVNFSMKGIMERMHKLNFLSSIESSDDITFPRLQKRLLQCKEETEQTFELFPHDQINTLIYRAKAEAVGKALLCGISLPSYEDADILEDIVEVMETAISNDGEDEEYSDFTTDQINEQSQEEPISVQEDLVNIRVTKENNNGLPLYNLTQQKGSAKSKTYALQRNNKSPFMLYGQQYIRKSTALYLIQENISLSNDRLLRVRKTQLSHIHNDQDESAYPEKHVKNCDLCIFKRVDDPSKYALGRILQFSYMSGTKKHREFSGDYVDLDKEDSDLSQIGSFCNWYVASEEIDSAVGFSITHSYTQGYLSLDNYIMKIPKNHLAHSDMFAFLIEKDYLKNCIGNLKSIY